VVKAPNVLRLALRFGAGYFSGLGCPTLVGEHSQTGHILDCVFHGLLIPLEVLSQCISSSAVSSSAT